jgi:hypothetical protein
MVIPEYVGIRRALRAVSRMRDEKEQLGAQARTSELF